MRRSGKVSVFCLFLFFLLTCSTSPQAIETGDGPHSETSSLSVCQDKALFTIEAKDVPLSAVLDEISRKTGAVFTMRESFLSADHLSVSFSGLSLKDAIERVLRNYSYIVEQGEDGKFNIVLLALKGSDGIPQAPLSLMGKEMERSSATVNRDAPMPPGDDCRRLWFPDIDAAQHFPGGKGADRLQTDPGDTIARARQVLGGQGCADLHKQVIDLLSGLRDPRAADLLAEIAERGATMSLKGQATEALWHNLALSEFNNAGALSALNRLSSSADENVRTYAHHAIEDYKNYISKAQSGTKEPRQDKKEAPLF